MRLPSDTARLGSWGQGAAVCRGAQPCVAPFTAQQLHVSAQEERQESMLMSESSISRQQAYHVKTMLTHDDFEFGVREP